jgi:hypothetical protein
MRNEWDETRLGSRPYIFAIACSFLLRYVGLSVHLSVGMWKNGRRVPGRACCTYRHRIHVIQYVDLSVAGLHLLKKYRWSRPAASFFAERKFTMQPLTFLYFSVPTSWDGTIDPSSISNCTSILTHKRVGARFAYVQILGHPRQRRECQDLCSVYCEVYWYSPRWVAAW